MEAPPASEPSSLAVGVFMQNAGFRGGEICLSQDASEFLQRRTSFQPQITQTTGWTTNLVANPAVNQKLRLVYA
jgi:hypothetical protein